MKDQPTIRPINTEEGGPEEMQDWKISEYQANIEAALDSLKERTQERLDEGRYQIDIFNRNPESHDSNEENNNTSEPEFNEDYFTPWPKELKNLKIDSSRMTTLTRKIQQTTKSLTDDYEVGGVETATMKQIFFGKFEKLWKIFRIFEKFLADKNLTVWS